MSKSHVLKFYEETVASQGPELVRKGEGQMLEWWW